MSLGFPTPQSEFLSFLNAAGKYSLTLFIMKVLPDSIKISGMKSRLREAKRPILDFAGLYDRKEKIEGGHIITVDG